MGPRVTGRPSAMSRGLSALNCFLGGPGVCWSEHGCPGFEAARRAPYRGYRAGRGLSRRIPAWPRLHGTRRQAAVVLVQYRAHRSSLRRPARRQCAVPPPLWRHDGFDQPDQADAADPANRDLQPRSSEPCRRQFRKSGIYRQCRRHRRAATVGSNPDSRHGEGDAVLPGIHFGAVWTGSGGPAKRNHAVLSALAYGVAKLYGYWITVNYREAYGMFASNGILFNHESPIRGETFVTRKITRGVARIEVGLEDTIYLGNLEAKRDWGHARDYVEGMHSILQADQPDDFVLATGETRSVRELVELAFAEVGRSIEWRGKGVDETGVDRKNGKTVVRIDPVYFRPTEVDLLIGDASKAREKLGWKPKTTFTQLVKEMMAGDLATAKREVVNGKAPV